MPQLPRSRLEVGLVAGGLVLGLLGAVLADSMATRAAALQGLASRGLDELAELASLVDERGQPLREDRFPVRVLAEDVDAAAMAALSAALATHARFVEAESEHVARIEVVESETAMIVQLRLWRHGWDLRTAAPARMFIVPFRLWLATLVGLLALVWTRWHGLAALATGLLAQVVLLGVGWPPGAPVADTWASNVRHGPLATVLSNEIRRLPDAGVAGLAAVVAFCLALVWFDHKRTARSSTDLGLGRATLTAMGITGGLVLWVEAAWRAGAFASLAGGGAIAAVGMVMLIAAAAVGRVTHPPDGLPDGPTTDGPKDGKHDRTKRDGAASDATKEGAKSDSAPDATTDGTTSGASDGARRVTASPPPEDRDLQAGAKAPGTARVTATDHRPASPSRMAPAASWSRARGWAAARACVVAAVMSAVGCGVEDPGANLRALRARVQRAVTGDRARPVATAAAPAPVASVSTTDAWLDLVAQRPSAVLFRGGRLVIDPTHRGITRHLDPANASPFLLEREGAPRLASDALLATGRPTAGDPRAASVGRVPSEGEGGTLTPLPEERVALLGGRTVSLWFPLDGALSPAANPDVDGVAQLAMALELRALAPKQIVTVFLNETPLVNLEVPETWQRRTLSLPRDKIVAGDNVVRLHFRHVTRVEGGAEASAEFRAVEVGRRDAVIEGPAPVGGWTAVPSRSGSVSLSIPGETALVYYVVPPRRARLRLDVRGTGTLDVLVSTDEDHATGAPPSSLARVAIEANGTPMDLDLSGYGGLPIRLELLFTATDASPLSLDRAEIAVSRARPKDNRDRRPRDVYVLAVEGLRYDDFVGPRLGGVSLEHFDRLRRDGLFFTNAHAVGAAAVPSQAGLVSSMTPAAHLTPRGTFVAESRVMLAESFARSGYATTAVVANADVSAVRGLAQGFDEHRVLVRGVTGGNTATQVVDALLEQRAARDAPRFGWATFSDPQAPYHPPNEWIADLPPVEGVPPSHTTHMWIYKVARGTVVPTSEQLEHVHRLYVGELRHLDAALGRFLETLERDDALTSAIVVLVGVHGEEFLEHGGMGHGSTLFEESVHVPLLIHAPELLAPGRVTTPVDLLDLSPTLTDLVGLNAALEWQGESLIPVIDDPVPPPRASIASLGDGSRAVWVDRYKLIVGPGRGGGSAMLFDLEADPEERQDLAPQRGIAFRVLRTALAWEIPDQARWKRARWGTGANLAPAFAIDHGM